MTSVAKNYVRQLRRKFNYLFGIVEYRRAGNEQVLPAVIVKIGDSCPPPRKPGRSGGDPGFAGDVFKVLAGISKKGKRITSHSNHKNVGASIIVHIAEICSHPRDGLA